MDSPLTSIPLKFMKPSHVLGIDLGTSNCAAATTGESGITSLPIPQPGQPGSVVESATLPSCLFLPLENEFAPDSFRLPWGDQTSRVTGAFARERGPLAPDRQITSAKSWLCHTETDRKAAILPWQSEAPVEKCSPVEVSTLLLNHIWQAYRASHAEQPPEPGDIQTVITLPASFDETARALTQEAAKAAGFEHIALLEEPQAAFYAWTEQNTDSWRDQVSAGDLILVCDIGGGTADFSLIAVSDQSGDLALERISVGEHILLGGDNLDLALAHALQAQLNAEGHELDTWQFLSLTHAARSAKEQLFSDAELTELPVAVAGRGSSLFASTVSTTLSRDLLHQIAIDGFLALTASDDLPQKGRATGLREFGLPYAADPVISKHLARFLARSLEAVTSNPEHAELIGGGKLAHASGLLLPTAILFNGGFFKAAPLRARIQELLKSWAQDTDIRELQGGQLDLSVSLGAAVYGRQLLTGEGLRIKSSTARAYYIGLESGAMAIPGFTPPIQAICVCPVGLEEGSTIALPEREFGLVVGEPAEFRFFSSTTRGGDQPGDKIPDALKELTETASIEITLPAEGDLKAGDIIPVHLETRLTEIGALELYMRHTRSDQTWNIEFTTRETDSE
jgi:hypothetical protein